MWSVDEIKAGNSMRNKYIWKEWGRGENSFYTTIMGNSKIGIK